MAFLDTKIAATPIVDKKVVITIDVFFKLID